MSRVGYDSPDISPTLTPPSYMKTWCKQMKRTEFQAYLETNVKESASNSVPHRGRFKKMAPLKKEKSMYERWTNMSIFRIRSGHTLTNSHFNRFDEKQDSECRYCHSGDETPEHLLIDCQHFYRRDWWLRQDWRRYTQRKYPGLTFNEIVVKDDKETIRLLRKLLVEMRKFGVVM